MAVEALCPHPNLKALTVWSYRGVKPPSWLPSITNLVSVGLLHRGSIQWLPPLDHLPHLKTLNLCNLTKLESIDVENEGTSSPFFPSLMDLTLCNCPNLKGFQSLSTQERPCFPCLSEFRISGCPNLIHLPLYPELEIGDFDTYVVEIHISSKQMRQNLKKLEVSNYRGVKPPCRLPFTDNFVSVKFKCCTSMQWLLPCDQLPHLKMLEISNMSKLEHVEVESGGGFSSFPSLTELTLEDCPNLKGFERLSMRELPCFPCLSKLNINGCPNLSHLPLSPELKYLDWEGMKSLMEILKIPTNSAYTLSQLQHLRISDMEDCTENELNNVTWWQSLKALRSVQFVRIENMAALPKGLQYVTTLQNLDINGCPRLDCIPKWMPERTALQCLCIFNSPLLEERCKDNSAEDWPKISNIRIRTIGLRRIA